MDTETLYPCPCCGYLTLYEKPPGTYLVCPICFWEDNGIKSGLRQAQRNFIAFGACHSQWLDQVRSPTENDIRVNNWQPLAQLADAARPSVIKQIASAFANVTRDDGVSLHEAYVICDYPFKLPEDDQERVEARKLDTDSRWQELRGEWIEKYSLSCLDPQGWRYYIPAYMIFALKDDQKFCDWIIWSLGYHNRIDPHTLLLNEEQSKAVCQFIQFIATYRDDLASEDAQTILEGYWGRFC